MHLPPDWETEPASGYGNLSHLVHTRCRYRSGALDMVLDQQNARRVLADHECDDLREQREEQEAREERERANRDNTDRRIAELQERVRELNEKLYSVVKVATPAPIRMLVLDITTPGTLNAAVDALAPADFLALASAIDTAQRRENERTALAEIREVLRDVVNANPEFSYRAAIGVLFRADTGDNADFLSAHGQVLFGDGTTTQAEFANAAETFMELHENVGRDATLAVDLRTDTFEFSREPSEATIHERFGITPSRDDRIVALVRQSLDAEAGEYESSPLAVQFRPRHEEDGYYLSSDDGMVLFADGQVEILTFPGIARLFGETIGCVGEQYTLTVSVHTGTVTTCDNDWSSLHQRFNMSNPG